jgi:hypothetical protein
VSAETTAVWGHRDGHAIRVVLHDQEAAIEGICPFSPAWDDSDSQPDGPIPECRRRTDSPWPSGECLVAQTIADVGNEVIDLPSQQLVAVTAAATEVSYWWEGDGEMFIRPLGPLKSGADR